MSKPMKPQRGWAVVDKNGHIKSASLTRWKAIAMLLNWVNEGNPPSLHLTWEFAQTLGYTVRKVTTLEGWG